MPKVPFTLLLLIFSLLSNRLDAQFMLPKVAADMVVYNKACRLITSAGYSQRKDIKYIINDNKVTAEKYNDRIVKFNKEGKVIECVYLYKSSRRKAIVVYEYYSNSLPKSETEFHPTGEMLKRTEYKYNIEYQLTEKSTIDQYGYVLNKIKYSVDLEENRLTEKKYPFPEVVAEKNIWIYDDLNTGKQVSHTKLDGETVLKFKRDFVYDKQQLIKEEYTNPAGQKAFFLEYTYNTRGLLVQVEKVLLNGTRLKNAVYKYNEKDLITGEIKYDRYGKIVSYYKYSYE